MTALLASAFILVSLTPVSPHDFWWHAQVGQQIVQQHTIPTTDTFSFTARGHPVLYQSWLSEVILYALLRVGGLPFTIFVQALTVMTTFGGLFWLCREASNGNFRLAIFCTLWALFASSNNWAIRPQSFSLLPFFLFLWLLRRYVRGQKAPLWLLPIILVIWVNLHGAFILGPILALLVLIGLTLDRLSPSISISISISPSPSLPPLLITTGALLPAILLNPRGIGVISYVVSLLTNPPSQQLIMEWRQPDIHGFQGRLFYLLLLACLLAFAISRRRLRWADLLPFVAFTWMGLTSIRYVIWLGFVAAPLLASTLADLLDPDWATHIRESRFGSILFAGADKNRSLTNTLLVVLFAFLAALSLPWNKERLPLPASVAGLTTADTPVAATRYLLDHNLPGPLFHDMGYGSYLIWAAWPQVQVFADPRVELYPLDLWLDYAAISAARYDYAELLDRYHIETLMIDRVSQAPLVTAVTREGSGWRTVYDDGRTVILRRTP
jgi:hypothetical protein